MSKQEAEFAEEEKARWVPESLRSDEFDKLFSKIAIEAENEEKQHEAATDGMLREQQAAFVELEMVRNRMFERGQAQRTDLFAKTQERREEDSNHHEVLREERRSESRKEMKDVCEELQTVLQEQFNSLLVEQERAFLQNEKRRNDAIQRLVDNTNLNLPMTNGVNHNVTVPQHKTRSQSVTRLDLERLESPSVTHYDNPQHNSNSTSPPPEAPVPVRRIYMRSPSNSSLEYGDASLVSLREHRNSFPENPSTPSDRNSMSTPSKDESPRQSDQQETFGTNQSSRMHLFHGAEQQRENEFRSAEAERDAAEDTRRIRFHLFAESLRSGAEVNIDRTNRAFFQAEETRDLAEVTRGREYDLLASFMATSHEEFIKALERRAVRAGADMDESMAFAFSLVLDRQARVIQEALVSMDQRFSEAQKHRGKALGVAPVFVTFKGVLSTRKLTPPHSPMPPSTTKPSTGLRRAIANMQAPLPTASDLESEKSRDRWPRPRRPRSPPTGFAARALLVKHSLPSLPLPDDHREIDSKFMLNSPDIEWGQQILYEKSKARRASIFAANAARRQKTFLVAERKRQYNFRKEQRKRLANWEESKRAWAKEFNGILAGLRQQYAKAKDARAKEFIIREDARALMFKEQQLKREEDYHKTQKELDEECFRNEDQRGRRLWEWGNKLRHREMGDRQAFFDKEEWKREGAFLDMLLQVEGAIPSLLE